MRANNRKHNQLREITIERDFLHNADGSCLIKFGNTQVICSANYERKVPRFLKNSGQGWLSAEYAMIPSATHQRNARESINGKVHGRTLEIQRLISRSLRACCDLSKLKEEQILIDCDVINADGSTRCASITGAYIALSLALSNLKSKKIINHNPLIHQVAAVSCGFVGGKAFVDLDYAEDSNADVDANFVFASNGNLIEVQASAEKSTYSKEQFLEMYDLAAQSASEIFHLQNKTILNL